MSLLSRLVDSIVRRIRRPLSAKYDAAQSTDENTKHWVNADSLSANAANTPLVRWTLRNRSRYEVANNSYAKGLLSTLAHDLVGTGPRLQLGFADSTVSRRIEAAFKQWTRAVGLAEKLRIAHETRIRDGEVFFQFTSNPLLPTPTTLDVRLVEADQCTTTDLSYNDPLAVDGMKLDEFGNVSEYHFLKSHPGDLAMRPNWAHDKIDAKYVVHWFRPDRPGQARGIPEISSALPLFAQLRRYTLATLGAAEVAAMISGVMHTTASAADGASVSVESMDRIELERNALLSLPEGWEAKQFDAKQPISTYPDFKGEILNEIGRCTNSPFNVIAGNSSKYNYSSGRLDHLLYYRNVRVERARLESVILYRVFCMWYEEALMVPGLLPPNLPPVSSWRIAWYWDGFDSIDPQKDASANQTLLETNQTTLAEIYAEYGQDWEEQVRQIAKERALLKELGISPVEALPSATKPLAMPTTEDANAA
jgi:lambda family phage portal protein